ncbi:alpha/beta hydrolase [Paucibacter sp. B2R-40]|uniref:alpha/beta hydrolase n=1 Tax=Paucibacter sp. B2R-40 TaxID=2893554 RepID=UPI0021E3CE7C|nr:alpha/beta hydrolase [Paucibacter sp. B2R-40]MCV2353034.1 alpha/beta hydrolase [Paucibacter sp. B2R-40]
MPKEILAPLLGPARLLALVLLTLHLSACQSPIRLMPTPVSFRTGAVDPFAQAGATLHGTEVPVLYVTNRGAVIEKPEPIHTILPSERLRMGVAHVRIGDEALDWETLHRLSTSDDSDERPVVQLEWLEQMASLGAKQSVADSVDAQAFFALLNKALASSESQELVIYVHGSNNTMPRAAAQAAQLRHFTGRRVVVLSFLWPSAGSLLKYFTDVGNAKASVEPFVRLLELVAEHSKASSIDVLAYSAGAQIVSPALAQLGQSARPGESREQLRKRLRLNHIYFAAADIDTRRFTDELKHYVDMVQRVSNAGNLNDSALRFSALVNRASRIGRLDPTELDAEQSSFLIDASRDYGFDLIKVDPSAIPKLPQRSHAFWYEDPWVSSDLLGLLLLNAAPDQRGLESQSGPRGARYWTFPPDFDLRVKQLFKPAVEARIEQEAGLSK